VAFGLFFAAANHRGPDSPPPAIKRYCDVLELCASLPYSAALQARTRPPHHRVRDRFISEPGDQIDAVSAALCLEPLSMFPRRARHHTLQRRKLERC
jgi:hypothetical protein